jgi:hypothetical protein
LHGTLQVTADDRPEKSVPADVELLENQVADEDCKRSTQNGKGQSHCFISPIEMAVGIADGNPLPK